MQTTHRLRPLAALPLIAAAWACGSDSPAPYVPGQPLSLDVSATFAAGTALKDAYGGTAVTVAGSGTVSVTPDPSGVVLLEKADSTAAPFNWAGTTVYFAITDRFFDGDPSNNTSYGRKQDGDGQEIGTWHGGDLKGLTAKLDYLAGLGVGAVWISPIVEQVHGWVSGGTGDFKNFGYAGYWALDYTRIDANFGTPADLTAFVDAAHAKGIRVLLDVVINHPGYATGDDLVSYLPEVFQDGTGNAFKTFTPAAGKNWLSWNDLVNYGSNDWGKWWTPKWIRAGLGTLGQFDKPGSDPLTMSLSSLPDFKTESTDAADAPLFWSRKSDTGMALIPGYTVRQHLIKWHADFVRTYGIDGFRCDTAKNVEVAAFKALKDAATPALAAWKAANPTKKTDDAPFWMTGEVYGHGVTKDTYFFDGGFDSVINFNFQPAIRDLLLAHPTLAEDAADLEALYAPMASAISADPSFDVLSYLSSHDTHVFFGLMANDAARQRQAGTALLLTPGGAQIFYGDESGRKLGPSGSDDTAGTRSDMNWSSTDATVLAHFQKLGTFRKKHSAIGAGAHAKLPSPPGTYAFSRKLGTTDAVVVAITGTR